MGKREVTILDNAVMAIAEIAYYVEGKGMPNAAKSFVDDCFEFFDTLAIDILKHKDCIYQRWKQMGYSCVSYKKKYVVAYLSLRNEVIICDFVPSKLLKE